MKSPFVKITVPMLIRLMELAREDLKQDIDIHKIVEVISGYNPDYVINSQDYDNIIKSYSGS